MAPFLRKCVIAVTGHFGDNKTDRDVQRWVERAGGSYVGHVDKEVTHLVCSKDHFKRKMTKVKDALQHSHIKIVNFDWLEDSLYGKSPKHTGNYLLKPLAKERASTKAKKRKTRKECEVKTVREWKANVKEFQDLMHCQGHHVYRDDTGFEYAITITRLDQRTNSIEQFVIKLWETHAAPHFYSCTAVHTIPTASRTVTQLLASPGSPFQKVMDAMAGFFAEKTMTLWEERLVPNEVVDNNPLAFAYKKPSSGPYGRLPDHEEEELATKLVQEIVSVEEKEVLDEGGAGEGAMGMEEGQCGEPVEVVQLIDVGGSMTNSASGCVSEEGEVVE